MATSVRGGASPYGQRPPGNALFAKEQAATARQAAGKNPGFDPGSAIHALLHGTQSPADAAKQNAMLGGQQVQAPTLFTGATAALDALRHLPSIVSGAHDAAVKIAHPSAANPPSIHQNILGLLNGAFGIPRLGTNFEKKQYPPGTLFHGSPDGELGKVDALHHTKPWREGPGFYLTSDAAKAAKYAAGKTASAVRRGGTGAVNAFRLKPGANVVNLDVQPPEFWHGLAEKIAGKVDPATYAQWASDIHPDEIKGASVGIVNRLRLMHFLTGYEEMPRTDAYYAIEDALHESGVHATLHHEGGVPVHIVKDASVLERVQPIAPHPLLAARPTIQKGLPPTVKTLGDTTTEALQGARGLRASQESLRNAERGSRARSYGKSLQANPTMAGHLEAKQLLSGELPRLHFGGFEHFTPEALDAMVKHVADHPQLQEFQKTRTIDALGKIHGGTVPTEGEEKLLRQAFGPDVTKQLVQSVSRFQQLKATAYDVGNLPRSVMASFDASGILRQALMVATGHPRIWARNVPEYFKAIKSEQVYDAGMAALHARPNAVNGVYEKMGVDLTEMAHRGEAAAREEAFRSTLAEKIPGVRMSGRGFTLFLDNARADLADLMYEKALKQGRDVNDPRLLESIGSVVNSSSGRGDLGEGVIGRSQEGLNLLLFSPRLIKSRVDFLNPVWYAKLDPLARHEAYRAMGGLVVMMATTLGIAREAGAKVNLDPRSSDFAKIKIGNTRLDFGGGFLQYIRLLSQIATQQVVSVNGKTTNLGQAGPGKTSDFDVLFRFLRSKLAPITSVGVDVSQRQNTIGQPLTWQNTVLARLTPLSGQDALSVGKDTASSTGSTPAGVLAGLGAFGLSAIGGGVQNYTPKPPKGASGGYGQRSGGGSSYGGRSSSRGSAYGRRP